MEKIKLTIYKLTPDFAYDEIDLQPMDLADSFPDEFSLIEIMNFSRDNIALKDFWPKASTGFLNRDASLPPPDISLWMDGVLILSPVATIYLGAHLSGYGEMLPLIVAGQEWTVFNSLAVVPLTSDNKQERDIRIGHKTLFKCESESGFGLFCQDKFAALLSEYGLKGITLQACELSI